MNDERRTENEAHEILRFRFSILRSSFLFLVHGFRIKHSVPYNNDRVLVEPSKEAAQVAFMAGGAADLMYLEQHRVGVAVEEDLPDFLDVARFLALAPQALPAAAKVDGPAGTHGLLERFLVHPRQHQHLPRGGI